MVYHTSKLHFIRLAFLVILMDHVFFGHKISKSRIDMSSVSNDTNRVAFLEKFDNIYPVVKRDTYGEQYFTIRAFGETLVVRIFPDNLFLNNTKIILSKHRRTFVLRQKPSFYRGTVFADEVSVSSDVLGIIIDNVFQGTLTFDNDVYYIEPSSKYIINRTDSIIYRQSDVRVNFLNPKYDSQNVSYPLFVDLRNHKDSTKRRKRYSNKPKSCTMKMYADHRFHRVIGQNNPRRTIAALSYRFKEIDRIYRSHDFNSDDIGDNFGFILQELHIVLDDSGDDYPLKKDIKEGETGLYSFASIGFDDFCIAFGFTDGEWNAGVVGVAFTASTRKGEAEMGLCGSVYNAGLITTRVGGRPLTTAAHILVFAHELGHCTGSLHDEQYGVKECVNPSHDRGKYIMTTFAGLPNNPNSFRFSPCSIGAMITILSQRSHCFLDSAGGPVCGNEIVEDGEDCDCGPNDQCPIVDRCCTPSDVTNGSDETGCTYRRSRGYQCSPYSSPCCTRECQIDIRPKICSKSSECRYLSRCDGKSEVCPHPKNKPDGTACSDGNFCQKGSCNMSICVANGLMDCSCQEGRSCVRCCKDNSGVCRKITSFTLTINNKKSTYVGYGTPCNKRRGICDYDHVCKVFAYDRSVASLLDPFTKKFAIKWLSKNWYYVLVSIVIVSSIVSVSAKYMVCHRQKFTPDAKRVAELWSIFDTMDDTKQQIEESRRVINSTVVAPERRPFIEAMSRLRSLFPEASEEVISTTIHMTSSENIAVKQLIIRKERFLRLFNKN